MLTTLQDLGLELKGLSANVDKMAILDFTKVLVNISHSETDEENTFTLTATDKLSKVNKEPLVLKIKSLPNGFDVAKPNECRTWKHYHTADRHFERGHIQSQLSISGIRLLATFSSYKHRER